MDIFKVISENIEAQDHKSVKRLIHHHFKTANGKGIITFIINELCAFYIINNKWLLRYILASTSKTSKTPSEARILSICSLLCQLERRPLNLEVKTNICDKNEEIKNYLTLEDFSATPAIYKNMNLTYFHIHKKHIREALLYCFELVKSKKFDAVFYVLSKTLHDSEYYSMCKQLFFSTSKIIEKNNKIPMMIWMIMVACDKIEVIDEELINEKMDDDTSYLFVMLHIDEKLNKIVSNDREICTKEVEKINNTPSNITELEI